MSTASYSVMSILDSYHEKLNTGPAGNKTCFFPTNASRQKCQRDVNQQSGAFGLMVGLTLSSKTIEEIEGILRDVLPHLTCYYHQGAAKDRISLEKAIEMCKSLLLGSCRTQRLTVSLAQTGTSRKFWKQQHRKLQGDYANSSSSRHDVPNRILPAFSLGPFVMTLAPLPAASPIATQQQSHETTFKAAGAATSYQRLGKTMPEAELCLRSTDSQQFNSHCQSFRVRDVYGLQHSDLSESSSNETAFTSTTRFPSR